MCFNSLPKKKGGKRGRGRKKYELSIFLAYLSSLEILNTTNAQMYLLVNSILCISFKVFMTLQFLTCLVSTKSYYFLLLFISSFVLGSTRLYLLDRFLVSLEIKMILGTI